jgi:eukaryotic-like serine/threonine-protein kinase
VRAEQAAAVAHAARDAETAQRRSLEQRELELEKVVQFQTNMLGDLDAHAMGLSIRQKMHDQLEQSMRHAGRSSEEIDEALSAIAVLWHSLSPTDLARAMLEEHMLRRAVVAIDDQFADQPTVQASLLRTVSSVYSNLGLRDEGRPLIERAHSTQRSLLGPDHDETLSSLQQLISIHLMHHLLDDTERFAIELLDRSRQRLGDSHEDTIEAMRLLAIVVSRQEHHDEAQHIPNQKRPAIHQLLKPQA